jgi:RNA polymerase sigma-70 factor (ECF subfamily)
LIQIHFDRREGNWYKLVDFKHVSMEPPANIGQDADTGSGTVQGAFPVTHWSRVAAAKGDATVERREALNFIAERYWKPIYCFVRRQGYEDEQAKELVQEYFMKAFGNDLFAKADPARGRFRNFLLGSLKNFLKNQWRDAHAQKRGPKQGFVSIDELASESGPVAVPKDTKTPDEAYHRTWLCELVMRVLRTLEREYSAKRNQVHIELFRQRIIAPILDGAHTPSLRELAQQHKLTEKEVGARLVTVRRAYQRLLRDEIRLYASSEDEVASEIEDLWRFMTE